MHIVSGVVRVNEAICIFLYNLRGTLDFEIQFVHIVGTAHKLGMRRKQINPCVNMEGIIVQIHVVVVNCLIIFGVQF